MHRFGNYGGRHGNYVMHRLEIFLSPVIYDTVITVANTVITVANTGITVEVSVNTFEVSVITLGLLNTAKLRLIRRSLIFSSDTCSKWNLLKTKRATVPWK